MTDLRELARRRGLYFPAAESHGAVAGLYAYGPAGTALKRNVEDAWRDRFVHRDGYHELQSPTVVPESVFAASGHLDTFDDPVVSCPDCGRHHRADHLVEDATGVDDAEDARPVAIEDLIATHDVRCPACETALSGRPVEPFELMFETSIGPGDGRPGYLRPETAQGTIVEFPRLAEYARGRFPAGVAQVGRAYRNEISPRNAVVRQRELTMAELQVFYDPERDDPPLERVAEVSLVLYPADRQDATGPDDDPEYVHRTVRAAAGETLHPWIAYYCGVAREWLAEVGVDPDRIRFREHRAGELAHYAAECWDAEVRIDGDWIELAGVADRADNDLAAHAEATDESYALFREYDRPRTVERTVVDVDMSRVGPRFGDRAEAVAAALRERARQAPEAVADGEVAVDVDGDPLRVPADWVEARTETEREHGRRVRPHVVEPAFGVDRVVYAVLAHALETDAVDGDERTRLALPPAVAPTLAAVLPLTDDLEPRAREVTDRLRRRGLAVEFDDSGSIGRRYRRQDEVGTPYCVTLDDRTPEDDAATLRDRDSTDQVRVPLADLPELLEQLRAGRRTFADLR